MRSDEQVAFAKRLEAIIRPVLGDRVRLVPDAKGFPVISGAVGRIEYSGVSTGPSRDGAQHKDRLHVFTDHGRIIAKLLADGTRRPSRAVGDDEARLWFAADAATIAAVGRIIRPRIRRAASTGNPAALARARAEKNGSRQAMSRRASAAECDSYQPRGPRNLPARAKHDATHCIRAAVVV